MIGFKQFAAKKTAILTKVPNIFPWDPNILSHGGQLYKSDI